MTVSKTALRTRVRPGSLGAVAAGVAWVILLGDILRHRIFVSHDTLISYAHVWYISRRIWDAHALPLRMPVIGHGKAYAFPYGLTPWLTASLVRPILGDWSVTASLVFGTVGLIAATFVAFPELAEGWWAVAVLVNPALIAAALIGQIPFIWASALLLGAIACWRRERRGWATALAAAAQITHIAVVGPITLVVFVIGMLCYPTQRRSMARAYLLSVVIAAPASWFVLTSPVFSDSTVAVKLANFVETIAPRSLVVLVPIALTALRTRSRDTAPWLAPTAVVAMLIGFAFMWRPIGMPWAARAITRSPDVAMNTFLASDDFRPGATYRILRIADGKVGMYQMIRAGGRLDAEFFPESIVRRSWPDTRSYATFLRDRHVEWVMVWRGYTVKYKVNEEALLAQTAALPGGGCTQYLCVEKVEQTAHYGLYRVTLPASSSTS